MENVRFAENIDATNIQSLVDSGEAVEGRIACLNFNLDGDPKYVLTEPRSYFSDCFGILYANRDEQNESVTYNVKSLTTGSHVEALLEGSSVKVLLSRNGDRVWEVNKGEEIFAWDYGGKCTTIEKLQSEYKYVDEFNRKIYGVGIFRVGYALEKVEVNTDVYVKVYVKTGRLMVVAYRDYHVHRVVV